MTLINSLLENWPMSSVKKTGCLNITLTLIKLERWMMFKMLDIYLYRQNKKRKRITVKDSNKELVELLEQSPIKELRELKKYRQYIDRPFIECLKEAINNYIGVIYGINKYYKNYGEEYNNTWD